MHNDKDGAFDTFYLATEVLCSHRSSVELTQDMCSRIGGDDVTVIVSYAGTDSSLQMSPDSRYVKRAKLKMTETLLHSRFYFHYECLTWSVGPLLTPHT
jgi:hypothetical protein